MLKKQECLILDMRALDLQTGMGGDEESKPGNEGAEDLSPLTRVRVWA
jgi:hypothetical protein